MIVLEAVRRNFNALQYASPEIRNDPEFQFNLNKL